METITIDDDINVLYVTAKSFPDGILEAHEKLHALIAFSTDRRYFGISVPNMELLFIKLQPRKYIPAKRKN